MADKKDVTIPGPADIGGAFDEEDEILNFRPRIEFVEPDPEYYPPILVDEPDTIDGIRDRVQKLINGYDAVAKLVDVTQKRIDQRVKSGGGFVTKLNPKRDVQAIAAMKRQCPNSDPNQISFECYKKALNCLQQGAPAVPAVTASDITAAKSNPNKTAFGGVDNQNGENRAELSSPGMEPMDIEQFQKNAVIALHKLMEPLIKNTAQGAIENHKIKTPHK